MHKISPQTVETFAAQVKSREADAFWHWWLARQSALGIITQDEAQALLARCYQEGPLVGIEDNEEGRLFLLAAMLRGNPAYDDVTVLLILDAIFADASEDERLRQIVALRNGK